MIPGTGSWIRKWAGVRPNRTVWISGGNSYSYTEANHRVNQVASVLLGAGIPELHAVGVGASCAGIDVQTPRGEIRYSYEAMIAGTSTDEPAGEVALNDYQLIMYTSGTTGRPKEAVINHGNTYVNLPALTDGASALPASIGVAWHH
ncbi:MAG: AMP-binding protein [Acidimicrobiales bacterium]